MVEYLLTQNPMTVTQIQYLHPHSPLQFCISDQDSGIAGVFAVLSNWQPGEDFRITVLELVEEVDVCVRVASFLQVHQIRPTRLGGICVDHLVEVVRYICEGKTQCCQNSQNTKCMFLTTQQSAFSVAYFQLRFI